MKDGLVDALGADKEKVVVPLVESSFKVLEKTGGIPKEKLFGLAPMGKDQKGFGKGFCHTALLYHGQKKAVKNSMMHYFLGRSLHLIGIFVNKKIRPFSLKKENVEYS